MLSDHEVSLIKRLILDDSCVQVDLARHFKCSLTTIYKIKNSISRRDVKAAASVAPQLIERINNADIDALLG